MSFKGKPKSASDKRGATTRKAVESIGEPKSSAGNYCGKCGCKRINCGGRCNVCGGRLA